jgi:hypothetical protein
MEQGVVRLVKTRLSGYQNSTRNTFSRAGNFVTRDISNDEAIQKT